MKKSTIIILVLVFLIIIAIASGTIFYINAMGSVSDTSNEISVTIPSGSTAAKIGDILAQKKLIRNETAFKIYVKLNDITEMKAGEYKLNQNMAVSEIVDTLVKGPDEKYNTINITFLEGKNMRWIAKTIESNTSNTKEDVYNAMKDKSYLDSLIQKYWFITDEIENTSLYYPLEGYLFPDTYNFKNKNVSVQDIFATMLDEMEKKLEPYKAEIQKANISVHRLLTVASIVELESSNNSDRAGVASVIYNRLKSNMEIGSDVTTYYGIKVDMSERDLYQSEINETNAYNTRSQAMKGKLPAGPMSTVSINSIEAALHPKETDYLYFVADKNGKVYFAKTISEHNQNISTLKSQGLWYTYN